jgi:arsenic resistance protein ArsH
MFVYRSLRRTGLCSNLGFDRLFLRSMGTAMNGDLNNTAAERVRAHIATDPAYRRTSLAIPACEDDASIRKTYRPFLLDSIHSDRDWVAGIELSTILKMVDLQILRRGGERLRVLVLYGSMRER